MAKAGKPPEASKGGLLPALIAASLVGGGGGFGLVTQVLQKAPEAAPAHEAGHDAPVDPALPHVIDVPPIVTNLSSPGSFVRLQVSLVVDHVTKPPYDPNSFVTDVVAFLRTVPIERITGPAGLQHLREDLQDRADIRSAGLVHDVILHDLVVQ